MDQKTPMMSPYNASPSQNRSNNAPLRESMSPEFIPFGYSSPLNSFVKRGQNFNRRGTQKMYQDRGGNSSFNSPSSNNSSNFSPYNRSARFNRSSDFFNNRGGFRGNMRNSPRFNNSDISLYFHQSMIEDPWRELEEEVKNQNQKSPDQSKTDNQTCS